MLLIGIGRRDYRRFVVLARPRTGSNLIQGLLMAHPAIVAFGEIFHDPGEGAWRKWPYRFHPRGFRRRLRREMLERPVAHLETRFFRPMPGPIRAVGFRLFYDQARGGQVPDLWAHLASQSELHVIHLKRRNVLRTHLSQVVARRTGLWLRRSSGRQAHAPVKLSVEECRRVFSQTRAQEEEMDSFFRQQPRLEVTYEALVSDRQRQTRRLFDFLSVPSVDVAPTTRKQAYLDLRDAIANYDELRESFAGTPWSGFFES
jgi:LPS sulfotransferase NodH